MLLNPAMPYLLSTPPNLKKELADTLSAMESFGVRWHGTRFHQYLKTLETESKREPRRVILSGEKETPNPEYISNLWEAASQSRQLAHTRKIWNTLDATLLGKKLAIVVKGRTLQPRGSEPDVSRNTLLELVTAWLLHDTGFTVGLTDNGADVTASICGTGFSPFAVECKRPSGKKTIRKNFIALRKQLARRYAGGLFEHGIPVIGIDRVLDLSGDPWGNQSIQTLQYDIHKSLQRATDQLRKMAPNIGFSQATTPLGGVILLGGAFTLEPFGITTIEHMSIYNLAPLNDLRVAAYSALKQV